MRIKSLFLAALLSASIAGPVATAIPVALGERIVMEGDPADAGEFLYNESVTGTILASAQIAIGRSRGGEESDPADAGKLLDIA
ncbi:hypothetical protein V5F53_20715 [Xanthobacter sp. V4C-4]|uniref:hypothetical protein n=1 Tax=Xanthobacter cornucopiae TaxID=3119924 RepID=UPI003729F3DD